MAFPAKKPDLTMIFGIGGKKPKPSAPPSFGDDAEPDATDPMESQETDETDGNLTPEMLHYSGPEEHCAMCSHFTAPSTCDRFSDPVDEAGHCSGFQSADTGDQEQAADMPAGDEAEMEMPA